MNRKLVKNKQTLIYPSNFVKVQLKRKLDVDWWKLVIVIVFLFVGIAAVVGGFRAFFLLDFDVFGIGLHILISFI